MEMELRAKPKEGDQVWIWGNATSRPVLVTLGKRDGAIFKATPVGEPGKAGVISMFAAIFDSAKACADHRRAFVADQLAQFTRIAEQERIILEYLEGLARDAAGKLAHFRAMAEQMQSDLDAINATTENAEAVPQ